MSQFFQVLRCYKCLFFQVHQMKKSNKYVCKLCGEKQSIKRHYGIGTGKECRLHVQKLNGIRGDIDEFSDSIALSNDSAEETEIKQDHVSNQTSANNMVNIKNTSKWTSFVDETKDVDEPDSQESMYLGDKEVVLEIPKKKRKFKIPIATEPIIPPDFSEYTGRMETNNQENNMCVYNKFNRNKVSDNNMGKCKSTECSMAMSANTNKNYRKTKNYVINSVNRNENQTYEPVTQSKNTTYIPPKINDNSKWAQFAEEAHNKIAIPIVSNNKNLSKNEQSHLFSLCDDSELDDVLNF